MGLFYRSLVPKAIFNVDFVAYRSVGARKRYSSYLITKELKILSQKLIEIAERDFSASLLLCIFLLA
jgi:hypothetical protein